MNQENRLLVTLDDLAAKSSYFDVPLQLLRRERELNWEALEIPEEARAGLLKDQREIATIKLISWIDCMRAYELLNDENADELTYQLLDLRDDTPGKTARDGRRPQGVIVR